MLIKIKKMAENEIVLHPPMICLAFMVQLFFWLSLWRAMQVRVFSRDPSQRKSGPLLATLTSRSLPLSFRIFFNICKIEIINKDMKLYIIYSPETGFTYLKNDICYISACKTKKWSFVKIFPVPPVTPTDCSLAASTSSSNRLKRSDMHCMEAEA